MTNSQNDEGDVHHYLMRIAAKVMDEMEEACIRDRDASQVDKKYVLGAIRVISKIELLLDVLLISTQNVGGFGSSYPTKCLEHMKTMRTILEMELNRENLD